MEGSYYHRNRDNRKNYQKLYYEAKKGRRKVSKAARQAAMGRRRREQSGKRSTYRSPLTHSNPVDDPCRDSEAESTLQDAIIELRDQLSDQLGENNWVPDFKQTVQTWIDGYMDEVHEITTEGDHTRATRLHHLRRIIAGLRQEQDLADQGRDARRAVVEDLGLVLWGRRVNTIVFFKLYGW
ncbi:hypothetical protein FA95DRAFT_1610032 [Auriscalpium vulgare]|uniref:Uncharacterized protein n=1 Tax=Auriscalpium vulgare TaxID=40419 RepID=A0ACB8REX1_9AGAM|nr:hypothetical protein FA95DRAFT_1610032 [Auriscalpium vulgare]